MKLINSINITSVLFATIFLASCGGSDEESDPNTYRANVSSTPQYYGVDSTIHIDAFAEVQNGVDTVASDIFNFEYEFGTSYELRVGQFPAAPSGDGATIILTSLIEVVSATPDAIGTSYRYDNVELRGNPFTEETTGIYGFYQYDFLCADNVDCDALVAIADSGGLVSVEFEYTGGDVPITLVWWN
ncbi:hypothetical protein [Pseudidiomarina sp.]|uniref:hypothetical protein n=1 Tax=Pseudidiomarina sp. TaxID=2081707 RepID=UPI003A983AC3